MTQLPIESSARSIIIADHLLRIAVDRQGEALIIHLKGQLKFDTVSEFQAFVRAHMDRDDAPMLRLECAQIMFIDSQALAVLLALARECEAHGRTLVLCNPRPAIQQLFVITCLDSLIRIEGVSLHSAENAIQSSLRVPIHTNIASR